MRKTKKTEMMEIKLHVRGDPVAQKRHRDGKRWKYDPSATEKRDFLAAVYLNAPVSPIQGAIRMDIQFYMKRPKSHYRTGRNKGQLRGNNPLYYITRPDLDNLVKFVKDALNGVFYRDDSQICILTARKDYSSTPGTEIIIKDLESER